MNRQAAARKLGSFLWITVGGSAKTSAGSAGTARVFCHVYLASGASAYNAASSAVCLCPAVCGCPRGTYLLP